MDDLATLPLDEVRSRRAALQGDEVGLSYLRRLVQGRLDIVAAAFALHEGRISPTLNFDRVPSEFGHFDVVAEAREHHARHALINSFGLGGLHTSLLLTKV